jgi:hypothetical protein
MNEIEKMIERLSKKEEIKKNFRIEIMRDPKRKVKNFIWPTYSLKEIDYNSYIDIFKKSEEENRRRVLQYRYAHR